MEDGALNEPLQSLPRRPDTEEPALARSAGRHSGSALVGGNERPNSCARTHCLPNVWTGGRLDNGRGTARQALFQSDRRTGPIPSTALTYAVDTRGQSRDIWLQTLPRKSQDPRSH